MDMYDIIEHSIAPGMKGFLEEYEQSGDNFDSVDTFIGMISSWCTQNDRVKRLLISTALGEDDNEELASKIRRVMWILEEEKELTRLEYNDGFDHHTIDYDRVTQE